MDWDEYTKQNGGITGNGFYLKPHSHARRRQEHLIQQERTPMDAPFIRTPPNGRVMLDNTDVDKLPNLPDFTDNYKQGDVNKYDDFKDNALGNIVAKTKLSNLFLSKENTEILQTLIRYEVYKQSKSKYVIGKQSTLELQVVMRSILLQFGKFWDYKLNEQVKELNQLVLNTIVPQIMTEVQQYEGYVYDIQNLPVPMERSINVSNKGSRQLPSWLK